jgi:glutaredoxin
MDFVIYTKNGCYYCDQIKKVLTLANIEYLTYDLDKDFTREDFYSKFGTGATFPQVLLNGNPLGGCTQTIKYIKENNLF